MEDILSVGVYSVLGIVLMMLGTFLIDLIIPCDFPEEIKKRNTAVGYIMAGASISVGIILKYAIMSPVTATVENGIFDGMFSSILYFFIGMIFCVLGYFIINLFHRKYDLNKEIGDGNPAAGIMVCGLFIGLGIVISGVIY